MVAALAAAIFVVQNNDRVRMHFLVFHVTARLWVGFLVSVALGVALGQAFGLIRRRREG